MIQSQSTEYRKRNLSAVARAVLGTTRDHFGIVQKPTRSLVGNPRGNCYGEHADLLGVGGCYDPKEAQCHA